MLVMKIFLQSYYNARIKTNSSKNMDIEKKRTANRVRPSEVIPLSHQGRPVCNLPYGRKYQTLYRTVLAHYFILH